jgi:hypothetical protein
MDCLAGTSSYPCFGPFALLFVLMLMCPAATAATAATAAWCCRACWQEKNYHSMDQMLAGLQNILLASTAAEAKAAAPATAAAASG